MLIGHCYSAEFVEFLDDETSAVNYRDAIKRMLRLEERRLVVNVDDLRDYKRELCDGCASLPLPTIFPPARRLTRRRYCRLLKDPLNYLPAFDHALKEVVMSVHDPAKHTNVETTIYYIALRGSFGDHHVNPRTLRAAMLGKMTCIEGIVTRCECLLCPILN